MIYSPPSVSFEAVTDFGTTGLVGTIGVRITDNVGNTVLARTTAGIIEFPALSGLYQVTLTAPAIEGQYSVVWDDADDHWSTDDLVVTSDSPVTVVGPPGSDLGPITGWITGDDVMDCCSVETTDGSIFDGVAATAQELLFQLSGRLFPGIGSRTVRPCHTSCGCGWQVLSRGHLVNWRGDSWWCDETPCGCRPLSRVKLAGYPVQEITAVKIDGANVAADTYRLDGRRYLTRVRDPADPDTVLSWPGCQQLDLEDTEDGTFSVAYTFGQNPPSIGIDAATQLACELYKECNGEACALPKGTTRLTRQGITIERMAFTSWAFQAGGQGEVRGWRTGLPLVDAFLNAYSRNALMRRPTFWSPASTHQYAPSLGS